MQVDLNYGGKKYNVDLSRPTDLSLRLRNGLLNPNCFWAPAPVFEPVRAGDFVGSTEDGGVVNFFNVRFNPHGNGTHTECVGHIAKEVYRLPDCLQKFHFFAKIISVFPQKTDDGDRVITKTTLESYLDKGEAEALIVRTLPNEQNKLTMQYSGINPPYFHHSALEYLVACGVEHLLVDLPSVDREEDGGALLGHRAFWNYPENIRQNCTITEMIFVPNLLKDGYFLLNLQTASFDLDASPSKPVVYPLDVL